MADAPRTPPARTATAVRAGGRAQLHPTLQALPWIAPATALIVLVVLFPAGLMIFNATREISLSGLDKGSAGFGNFAELFAFASLPGIVVRTLVWVVVVVGVTVIISMLMAQLLDKAFPGRRLVRMIVIIPWASSVVMTTMVVYYALDPYFGINRMLEQVGLIGDAYGFTANPASAFAWSIVVAVFVSLPFTTYTLLAGLQTVPREVLEAARVDGASRARTYFSIVLPQLRASLAVAILINIINVFNSLPILRVMTGSLPGYEADTIMTLIFKYLDRGDFGVASALSVVGFALVLVIVAVYLKLVRPLEDAR